MGIKFKLALYDADNLADAYAGTGDMICVDGLSGEEVEMMLPILLRAGANVCLLPFQGKPDTAAKLPETQT